MSNPRAKALFQRITSRTARTGVVGLGYTGLPLAIEFGRAGFAVIGIDTDPNKRDAINRGTSDVPDVPDSAVAELVTSGRFKAVPELTATDRVDTINICVPTPLRKSRDPDLSYVVSATRAASEQLRPGMLVILESTTYPGTTEEVVRDILEQSGLTAGRDFFLAFSPERVDPGNQRWNTSNIPKVVGGLSSDCTALASALYETCIEQVVKVRSPRTAEMVKLLENTFRAVNIGLVNELALMCDRIGVSIWEVIDAAATKPFGFMPFYPGPGLGGHCVPVDPYYLSWKVRQIGFEARFIDLAGQINALMPHHIVEMVADELGGIGMAISGARILLMGIAYKPDVKDTRESPALDVLDLLIAKGAVVRYHDPLVPSIPAEQIPGGNAMTSVPYSREELELADCVVVLTDHSAFDYTELVSTARLIIDTRNVVTNSDNVIKLGEPRVRNRRT
jgi:UDP-N-acetyl-D-glucosamine dehydrogenase